MEVTTKNGKRNITRAEIDCYRATSLKPSNCVVYLKSGEALWIEESFGQVDIVFNF